MGAKSLLVIAGVAILTLLYLVYLAVTFEAPESTTTIVIPPPVAQPLETEPEPEPQFQPTPPTVLPTQEVEETPEPTDIALEPEPEEILEEVVEEVEEAVVIELPSLNNSDSFVLERLRQLQNGAAALAYLVNEQIIRNFVSLVDNVSRGDLPQANLPYRTFQGELPVSSIDENLFVLDESGFARFNQAVDAFVAIDTGQAMSLYRMVSPLFQQAYTEIGYRDVNFDDTLRSAIRNVLETDEIEGPYQLVKPSVMYLYADATIENMSDIQKQIIRLGPENAEKLKAKLRQFMMQL